MEFFDRAGSARLYSPDGETLYTWEGLPVGFLDGDRVMEFSGACVAWLSNGWILDTRGRRVFFSPGARGGPATPPLKPKPMKAKRWPPPARALRRLLPPLKPRPLDDWVESPLTPVAPAERS